MFISTIAIKRPVFTGMVILALIVFGVICYHGLGVDLFPKVDFPIVSITTTWEGSDPETMELQVAKPIEDAVSTLAGIKTLRSTSAEGYSSVVAEFHLDKNVDVAYQEVQSRVNAIRATLPTDIDDPVIEKFDLDAAPIVTLIVSGDLSARDLYRVADKQIKERVQRVRNVGSIKIVGGRDRKMWLWIDPKRLEQAGLTVQDVRSALAREHVEMPGGRMETGSREYVTRTKAEFSTAAELDELVVSQTGDGVVRLKDIGRAEDGLEEERSFSLLNDKPGIALQVRRQSGTNTVQVADDVKAEVKNLEKELAAQGVRVTVAMDSSVYIKQSLSQVEEHLLVGGAMAVVTVLLFLLNFRSTLICAMVLPTSVLTTFIALAAAGFTLNFMTLMALMLAIGLLIDDAIVVQENIMRHVQAGKAAAWAAEFATREIGLAVMATTFSVVAVFLPTAFTPGIVGRFFFPFGLTVSCAVLISMFVSFTLDPMMSSRLLRKHGTPRGLFKALELAFEKLERTYERMLGWALGHRWTVVATAAGLFVVSMALGATVKSEFVPTEDQSEFNVTVRAPLGSPLEETRRIMEGIRRRIAALPEVEYTFITIGGGEMEKVNEGVMYVRMKPKPERQKAGMRSQMALMDALRNEYSGFKDALVAMQVVDMVAGNSVMKSQTIQLELLGPDLEVLDGMAQQVLAKMRAKGGYKDLDLTYEPGKPEARVLPDRERAKALGVSPLDVAQTVGAAVGGMDVGKFKADGERYDIAVRFLEHGRNSMERLGELRVPSAAGEAQELRNVAYVVPASVPVEINRFNKQRQITVLANLEQGKALGDAVAEMKRWVQGDEKRGIRPEITIPAGYTTAWTGQADNMDESFTNMGFTMLLSVLVIYMVLASQFESLVHPLTIMLSLPLALVGALLGLAIFRMTLNIFTLMAFIFLLGLVTKNAILLIDYANELRSRDGIARDAAMKRAGPVRLRPILMTTMAMIFGMLPAAVGTGEGSESRQPMAVAIIGGLISSTMLTLVVVPVVYSLLDPMSEWFKRRVLQTRTEENAGGKPTKGETKPRAEAVEV